MAEIDAIGAGKKEKKRSSSNPKKNDVKTLTLRSVAAFLEKNGFCRTFAAFLSESQLELNGVKGHSVDLDDVFLKFMASSKDPDQASNDRQEEKDVSRSQGLIERQACDDSVPQKKRKGIDDTSTKLNKHDDGNNEKNVANAMQEESEKPQFKNKQKKTKSKHLSNSGEVENEDIPAKSINQENENLNLGNQISEAHVKSERKKKKKSEVPAEKANQEKENLNQENQIDKSNEKSESKKRKKAKLVSDATGENTEQVAVEEKSLSSEAKVDSVSEPVIENQDCSKLKDKKRKKHNTASETKIDGQLDGDVFDVKNEDAVHENQDSLTTKTPNRENIHISEDTSSGKDIVNGKESLSSSKTTKKEHRHSAESKSINPFQRVKIDEVEFVDERLQDNSYWAKGGADTGYGAKAQEVLGQVRGRNFRHEKTKKKRGSYRGGQIDLESHSIKFNYSDDDE